MSLYKRLWFLWRVNIVGLLGLKGKRWAAQRTVKSLRRWESKYLAPPLNITPRTKELIARHYLEGRHANLVRKVAWVTSAAPVELLKALDYYVLYPENHGAICGTARAVVDISGEAESAGYSRDICSYARTDIGAMLSGKTPVGRLPRPDLLLASTNICQTVLFWYRILAHHFQVPLVIVDTPFIYTEAKKHSVEYVKKQLEEAIPLLEKTAGQSLDWPKLKKVTGWSKKATELWTEVIARATHKPSPISVFDQFIHMAPIVEMRGEPFTIDFYAAMLREIDERIARGIGAVKEEKKRLLWDNLPIWPRLRYLAERLGEQGLALVASTYTSAWGDLGPMMDPENPLESTAITYLHPILNQGAGHKFETMKNMIEKFRLDGAILHSDRSCKPYSIGQMDQKERLIRECGIPALLLEADHDDPRSFSEERVSNQLSTFMEILEA
jgi:benzoyl-CoA reductase/2-hydroxyglutaryl-CoA dehydratase subunit BcrC/BadD/HgdB